MQMFRLIDLRKAARTQQSHQSIIPKVLTKSVYHGNVFLYISFYTTTNANLVISFIAESIYYFTKKRQVEVQIFLVDQRAKRLQTKIVRNKVTAQDRIVGEKAPC